MKKSQKRKKPRAQFAQTFDVRTKVGAYWWPVPYDKKDRLIPSSVDCLYSQDYFSSSEASSMLIAL